MCGRSDKNREDEVNPIRGRSSLEARDARAGPGNIITASGPNIPDELYSGLSLRPAPRGWSIQEDATRGKIFQVQYSGPEPEGSFGNRELLDELDEEKQGDKPEAKENNGIRGNAESGDREPDDNDGEGGVHKRRISFPESQRSVVPPIILERPRSEGGRGATFTPVVITGILSLPRRRTIFCYITPEDPIAAKGRGYQPSNSTPMHRRRVEPRRILPTASFRYAPVPGSGLVEKKEESTKSG
ncbi:uncharacterized protein EI90DRAFT_3119532 [Cantharellus anzutake]|uniref:uncharacterized protein n=1 Tax=Cantharellus anzutake TaxID=1750568 RepID=UPI00190314A3|nr:uncharacterized protein EI90DRAFT_3119532 [Cantharellus anzutake]KAF8336267.1 hypothetical protein EI90DRAFT_3119532 [Cantharellus anzutake]